MGGYHVELDGFGDAFLGDVADVDLELVREDALAEFVGQVEGVFHKGYILLL
jgi:hypothetical protein